MRILQNTRTKPVTRLGITADGRTLVAAGDGGFEVYDLTNLDAGATAFAVPNAKDIFECALDPLGRWLYYAASVSGCCICDLRTGEVRRFPGPGGHGAHHVISLDVSRDGSRVALSRGVAMGNSNRLECWVIDPPSVPALAWSVPMTTPWCMFHGVQFHPSGRTLFAIEDHFGADTPSFSAFDLRIASHHAIVVRDAASGAALKRIGSVKETLRVRTSFSPTSDEYVHWDDAGVHLHAVAEHKRPRSRRHHGAAIFRGVAFHPSGRFFVTVANDGVARYWDLAALTQTQAYNWKVGKLQSVALSPDGTLAAAGTDKGQVVLWDVEE